MGSKRDRGSDTSGKSSKKKAKKKARFKEEPRVKKEQENGNADTQIIKKQPKTDEISNKLFDEEKPVFFRKRAKLSISLLPWSMRDCKKSVENSIQKMMLKYSNGLGGILMAYEDVEVHDHERDDGSKGKGWVLNELPYVHFDVSCNVLVFFPSIGSELKGVVNECFPSHVGILVFGYINAMVSAETIRETGYQFDSELQTWTKGSDYITSGVKITFVVTKIHECDGTISLEGEKPPGRSLLLETTES